MHRKEKRKEVSTEAGHKYREGRGVTNMKNRNALKGGIRDQMKGARRGIVTSENEVFPFRKSIMAARKSKIAR